MLIIKTEQIILYY